MFGIEIGLKPAQLRPALRNSVFEISRARPGLLADPLQGTGFVISAGRIATLALTAAHVVKELLQPEEGVSFRGRFHSVWGKELTLVAAEEQRDIALLSFPAFPEGTDISPFILAQKPPLRSEVFCLRGIPDEVDAYFDCTFGRFYGEKRGEIEVRPGPYPGFSGGPIIHLEDEMENRVVGMVCRGPERNLDFGEQRTFACGPSSRTILQTLARWSRGEQIRADFFPSPIPPLVKEQLAQTLMAQPPL